MQHLHKLFYKYLALIVFLSQPLFCQEETNSADSARAVLLYNLGRASTLCTVLSSQLKEEIERTQRSALFGLSGMIISGLTYAVASFIYNKKDIGIYCAVPFFSFSVPFLCGVYKLRKLPSLTPKEKLPQKKPAKS